MQIKEAGLAVMVNLSETGLRNHQVLPQESINQSIIKNALLVLLKSRTNMKIKN